MDGTFESASEYSMAVFVGALLAVLVAVVMMGRADDLRRGVRSLFGAPTTAVKEAYTPPRLEDYGTPFLGGEGDEDQ